MYLLIAGAYDLIPIQPAFPLNAFSTETSIELLPPTSNILENSNMTRDVCVRLASNSSELERQVVTELVFITALSSQFANMSE